jgi:hypothetical protein
LIEFRRNRAGLDRAVGREILEVETVRFRLNEHRRGYHVTGDEATPSRFESTPRLRSFDSAELSGRGQVAAPTRSAPDAVEEHRCSRSAVGIRDPLT